MCPVSGHPIREGSGFRVCGEAAVGYALSPRPTLASRGHLATRVKRSPAQHHHREASTRPSISPLVTRVYVAPRHNTHNSRHRHHGQFRQQAYRSATRLSISTTTNAAARRPFERACAVHSKQTMRNCPYFANAQHPRIARALNDHLRANNAPISLRHSPISRENLQIDTSDHGNTNTIYMYTSLE